MNIGFGIVVHDKVNKNMQTRIKIFVKLLTWGLYTLVFSLLPFGLIYLIEISKGNAVKVAFLFGRGELIIISLTLCALALGELLNSAFIKKPFESPGKILVAAIAGFFATLMIVIASFYYASILGGDLKIEWIILTSKWLFGFSIIICSSCIIIAETGEH